MRLSKCTILSRRFATKNRSKSSNQWLKRHESDPFVKRARKEGAPSRALYKLEQMDEMACKFLSSKRKQFSNKSIFQQDDVVLDLGAAPGGWTKYVATKLHSNGLLIAVDLLPLDDRTVGAIQRDPNGPSFEVIQGDFTSSQVKEQILSFVLTSKSNRKVNIVMSDMAKNTIGDRHTDALQTLSLCEDALLLAAGPYCFDERYDPVHDPIENDHQGILQKGGSFFCKYFTCGQEDEHDLMSATKRNFEYTTVFKPKASRKESSEVYLFASGYKGGIVH
jgi:23S rRNA (uridine2552-2'-O)-methyltransferase